MLFDEYLNNITEKTLSLSTFKKHTMFGYKDG